MKNQYYGDINDYKKYAYLRHIVNSGDFALGINWYLTEDDGSPHGGKTKYLDDAKEWKHFDDKLFSRLYDSVKIRKSRDVKNAPKDLGLGSKVTFFSKYIPHTKAERELWLDRAVDSLRHCNLIFLDPDNGLSVPSTPMGRKKCSKYVFDNEIKRFIETNSDTSLIVYQHFPRQNREIFMDVCCQRISSSLKRNGVIRIRTSNVLFIVVPSRKHRTDIETLTRQFEASWEKISVSIWEINH